MKLWQVTRGVLYNFTLCNISSSKKFTGRSAAEFTPCSFLHTGQSLLPLWIYCFSYEIKDKAWSKFSIHYHHMIFLLEVAKLLMLSSSISSSFMSIFSSFMSISSVMSISSFISISAILRSCNQPPSRLQLKMLSRSDDDEFLFRVLVDGQNHGG